jgi:RNA polymerase sigma-70 factor (ECF subfamily)
MHDTFRLRHLLLAVVRLVGYKWDNLTRVLALPMSPAGQEECRAVLGAKWFATTHWSVVLEAADEVAPNAQEALEKLCRTYWFPLYAYVRRRGNSPEDAEDLTQAFFARFLEKKYLTQVEREKGKFRSFLLACLNHFLSDERDRARAIKRGGGQTPLSLDAQDAEGRYALEPADTMTAEKIFERRWALTALEATRTHLREEFGAAGKGERFAVLERFLPGQQAEASYAQVGVELGVAVGTVKWEVHQLRQRYRDLLRAEIAHTVSHADQIDEEVRHLIEVLSG